MKKMLFLDCETSGLSAWKNDVLQAAGIIEVDGVLEEEFNLTMQPFKYSNIDPKAMLVHGITLAQLKEYPEPEETHKKLLSIFTKYINKFDKKDKFQVAGFNVGFDIEFMNQYFKKCKDDFFFSFAGPYPLDIYQIATYLHYIGIIPDLDNYKLGTLCKHYDITIDAHDAMSDIRATRELFKIFNTSMGKE